MKIRAAERIRNMKPGKILLLLFAVFFSIVMLVECDATRRSSAERWDYVPHFMVNGVVYWSSARPDSQMPASFQYAGDIREDGTDMASADWTACGLPVGTKIYLDPQIPYQAWADGKYRYCTSEMKRDYVMHDGALYVYTASLENGHDESYAPYRQWTSVRNMSRYETAYLGDTVFEGYDACPTQELGTNNFPDSNAQGVYAYADDPNVLFVGRENYASVYVKLKEFQ